MAKRRNNRAVKVAAAFFAAVALQCVYAPRAGAQTSASAACVMEQSSRRVLYEKNAHERRAMASTTKVMTALVALEYGYLKDVVTISPKACGVEGSSLYLQAGEQLTLEDLLYGLMLRSGNDAAVAIAEHIGGSVEGFADMMNRKAQELGAENTHFVTPNGLDADDHYTTAYDLALISAAAMDNPDFGTIVSTQRYSMPCPGQEWDRVVVNKNRLLAEYGADGIKTGYTKKAGRCLVASKTQNDMQLIAVALNCGPMFEDCQAMLDTAFARYEMTTIVPAGQALCFTGVNGGAKGVVEFETAQDIKIPLSDEERDIIAYQITAPFTLNAPVPKGMHAGAVDVYLDGQVVMTRPLCAAEYVPAKTYGWSVLRAIRGFMRR